MNTLPLGGQVALATSGSRGPGREFAQVLTTVFLASDAPSFMTGEVTVMDGDYSLF
jgi:hypothetical protein